MAKKPSRCARGVFAELGDDDYRMQHRAPDENNAPLHDLTANGVYPGDVYTNPGWYAYGDTDREAWGIASRVRNRPDARVSIFRAQPCEIRTIRPGDWVSTSEAYARQHGKHPSDPSKDMCVFRARTTANCLHTDGNSLSEWGYNCPVKSARISFRPRKRR